MIRVPWDPGDLDLPYERWRPGQRRAIRKIVGTADDDDINVIAACLPTGAGKSGIGIAAALIGRTAILTATRNLQDQYGRECPSLVDIRGMQNYPCLAALDEHRRYFLRRRGRSVVTCDQGYCHVDVPCSLKEAGCTYFDRVKLAKLSPEIITNYAYHLGTRIHARGLGHLDVVVADEAHALVEQITGALRIEVPKGDLRGMRPPRTVREWQNFAAAKLAEIGDDREGERSEVARGRTPERDSRSLMLARLQKIGAGWAWEEQKKVWAFEPITPTGYLRSLWTPPTKLVLLSATMTPASLATAGIEPDLWIEQPSTFPVKDRPVYVVKCGKIDYRTIGKGRADDEILNRWLGLHADIVEARDDRNGVIHTGSYERAEMIGHYLRRERLNVGILVPRAHELSAALDDFRCTTAPAVLLSPAVTTGVDLPGRQCEYQILSKVPFPDARAGIAKQRFRRIPGYKSSLIMQTIVQAAGRGVRYLGDRCEFLIIDDHAYWFLKENDQFAPAYFNDAVRYVWTLPPPLKRLAA